MKEKVLALNLDRVEIKDHLHRTKLDIDSLVESLGTTGQINPITVKQVGKKYQVIAGRRRFTALKALEKETGKKQKVLVVVRDLDEIQEELILIDENIIRKSLSEAEHDEALYRRKQLYEQLHPETKKHVAGGLAKADKAGKLSFSKDAAKKLGITKRTVERAIARASKATDKVKQARFEGLSPTKVDLLVSLSSKDQDLLLPVIRNKEVSEVRTLVEQAKKRGAKAVVLDLEELKEEDPRLKPLIRDAMKLSERIQEVLEERLSLEGSSKHESLRALDQLQQRIIKFTSFQRSVLGYVKAISKKGGETRFLKEAR